ncbi:hypothetical protein [Oceanobacillus senegalensis]|nr:hypothetical protein [Oceanobacillus senegalensis]
MELNSSVRGASFLNDQRSFTAIGKAIHAMMAVTGIELEMIRNSRNM